MTWNEAQVKFYNENQQVEQETKKTKLITAVKTESHGLVSSSIFHATGACLEFNTNL